MYVRKLVPTDTSGIANTAGIMTTGAVALTAVALLSGPAFVVPDLRAGAALLAMSVGGGVLSCLFWNAGIAKLGPARAAIFMNLVPVASMVIAAFSGAPPNHAQLLGGALVIGAVTFSALSLGERRGGYDGESSRSRAATRWDLHRRRGERPCRNVTGVRMPAIVAA